MVVRVTETDSIQPTRHCIINMNFKLLLKYFHIKNGKILYYVRLWVWNICIIILFYIKKITPVP